MDLVKYNFVEKTFKYRIYPNKIQEEFLQKQFNCNKEIFNAFLDILSEDFEKRISIITNFFRSHERSLQDFKMIHNAKIIGDCYELQSKISDLKKDETKYSSELIQDFKDVDSQAMISECAWVYDSFSKFADTYSEYFFNKEFQIYYSENKEFVDSEIKILEEYEKGFDESLEGLSKDEKKDKIHDRKTKLSAYDIKKAIKADVSDIKSFSKKSIYRINSPETPDEMKILTFRDFPMFPKYKEDDKYGQRSKFTNNVAIFNSIKKTIKIDLKKLNNKCEIACVFGKNFPKQFVTNIGKFNTITKKYALNKNVIVGENNTPIILYKSDGVEISPIFNNITVIKTNTNKYFACISLKNIPIEKFDRTGNSLGMDWGLKAFVTTDKKIDVIKSDNNKKVYEQSNSINGVQRNSDEFREIKKYQKKLAKCTEGSINFKKYSMKISLLHEKIGNKRKDFQNKLALEITRQNDFVCIESLSMKNLSKQTDNKTEYVKWLADNNYSPTYRRRMGIKKFIATSGWSSFISILKIKMGHHKGSCDESGKLIYNNVIEVGRKFPSTQICNVCGFKNDPPIKLSVREWVCPECGSEHDRDVNAAINIHNKGMEDFANGVSTKVKKVKKSTRTISKEKKIEKISKLNLDISK